jgi:multicomponent Na+:H+ antiporter subunit G
MSTPTQIVVAVLVIGGSLFFLVSALAMLRTRDAISRVNNMSPATGMGLPLILLGAFVHETAVEGWSTWTLAEVVLTILASLVVSSVASNVLGRSAYRAQAGLDPHTLSNALEDEPPQSS